MDPRTAELRSLFETIKDGINASIRAHEHKQEHTQDQDDNTHKIELKLSDVARAIMVRRQYGCVLSAENCNEWLESKPLHGNIRVAFDLLQMRKSGDGIIGDIPDAFINWMIENPRLLLTCSSRLGRVRCMFALLPSKGDHVKHDATDEILNLWKQKCDVEPMYTGAHVCISANPLLSVLLLRKYITFDESVRTWPNVYACAHDRTSIRMHMNEAMLYQHIMDVWFVDGAQDTRCIVTGDKFALVPRDTQKRMMLNAKTQVEELANKYKYSHDVSMDKQLLQVKLHPVDKKVIIKRIQKAYPELRDIAIKFTWQCPKKEEFEHILSSHHMTKVRQDVWSYHVKYKQPKSTECVPFNPAEISPLSCLRKVGSKVYGSEARKWGYHNIETCLRLCHRHLPVWIPREIWNGIVRLALYYHAGEVLSKIFKLPIYDMTFEKIITMSRP